MNIHSSIQDSNKPEDHSVGALAKRLQRASVTSSVVLGAVFIMTLGFGTTGRAAEPLFELLPIQPELLHPELRALSIAESYALGVNEFALNYNSKVTGWQVAQSFGGNWYFGQKQGNGSGLSLVWQKSTDQVSFSTNGIRFTRNF